MQHKQSKKVIPFKDSLVLLLIFLILAGSLFNPRPVQAVGPLAVVAVVPLIGQIFKIGKDVSQGWLDAIDFIDNSAMTFLVWLALITALSAGFLIFSANFLDWAAAQPIDLTPANLLVHQGWNFIAGLVNMLFILILIAIALAYIFKTDTWGMKKALPRLLVIAFLLNFSLLFVQMFVDLGWVVQNSFKNAFFEEGKMVQTITGPIGEKLAESLGKQSGQLVTYAWAGAIPIKVAAKLIKFLSLIAGEAILGTYSQTILLIIFSLLGGFIFFVYGVLFLLRIAVIWLLAVLAPLAFMAFILPQTQKYFHQWLKVLFQWTFFGIVIFFLMGIGIKLFTVVAPAHVFVLEFGETGWGLAEDYSKFIFLLIYLGAALWLSKKLTPMGTEGIWSAFGKAGTAMSIVGGLAALRGARTITKAGIERPVGTYQYLRESGMGRRQAFTEATRRTLLGARQELWPKGRRLGAMGRITRVARATGLTGILKAAGDTAKAGALAGLGIKLKKKGFRRGGCPACHNQKVAASAKQCPTCGYDFAGPTFVGPTQEKT